MDGQVTMELSQVVRDGKGLRLNVTLQNNSGEPVEFLYSFLEVRDQQKNLLSSLVESLPQNLPSDGQSYEGTVEIFGTFPEPITALSLRLASYPDERVRLQVDNLPVPSP